jgi:hypothetical protein
MFVFLGSIGEGLGAGGVRFSKRRVQGKVRTLWADKAKEKTRQL